MIFQSQMNFNLNESVNFSNVILIYQILSTFLSPNYLWCSVIYRVLSKAKADPKIMVRWSFHGTMSLVCLFLSLTAVSIVRVGLRLFRVKIVLFVPFLEQFDYILILTGRKQSLMKEVVMPPPITAFVATFHIEKNRLCIESVSESLTV